MLSGRLLICICVALTAWAAACGDDDDDAPSGPDVDLATDAALATITFGEGDIEAGFQHTIATGDFNADGVLDLLLGAPLADGPDETRDEGGEAYVLFGPLESGVDLANDEPDLLVLGARPGDNLGSGVLAGDLNGDGIDDVIVGASASDAIRAIRTDMGEIYVIFGGEELGGTIDTLEEAQDVTFQPAEGFSQLGRAMATGDVNGDGIADLVAGAPYAGRLPNTPPGGQRTTIGEVYVFHGRTDLGGVVTVARDQDDQRLTGLVSQDQFGIAVAVEDLDGDGTDDVIVGASGYDGQAGDQAEAGGLFVFYGSRGNSGGARTTADADLSLVGNPAERLGTHLALGSGESPGSIVMAVGAQTATALGVADTGTGRVYVIAADALGQGDTVSSCGCATAIGGSHVGGFLPGALAATGDGGFAIGYPTESFDGRAHNGVVLVSEGVTEETDLALGYEGFTAIRGPQTGAGLGSALAIADVDGDRAEDLLAQAVRPAGAELPLRPALYVIKLPD